MYPEYNDLAKQSYIIEFTQIGNSIKVSATCTVTYTEGVIVVPSNISVQEMKHLAIRKLEYLKSKK